MLDIIGAISLTGLFGLCCAVLASSVPIDAAVRAKAAVVALAWFAGISLLAAMGVFASPSLGTPAIGIAVLTPVVLFLVAAARSAIVWNVVRETPLPVLVGIHLGRVLGIFFVLLFYADRLPPTFALTAGWGDVAVAIAALPIAWAIQREASGWRWMTLAWNVVGFGDLVTAVTLGVGSASSPLQFIFESPHSGAVAALPWVLIPAILVPLYLLTHLAIFAQLARAAAGERVLPGTARPV
jgi:hypothetical protein